MQSGELIVVGKDTVEIEIGHRRPDKIIVKFKNEHEHVIVPCNPHHHDDLKWELKNMHHQHRHDHWHDHCNHNDRFVLIIQWHVTGIRTIEWIVCY